MTSESVTEGHPDKVADQISDAILDAILQSDPDAHVACETFVTTGLVLIGGEISTTKPIAIDYQHIVREMIKEIGYDDSSIGFDYRGCAILNVIHSQSPDIAQGVVRDSLDTQGAGDQGIMVGYACNETPEYLPLATVLAHKLTKQLAIARKSNLLPFLRPDGKSLVSIEYTNGKISRINAIVVAAQHTEDVNHEEIEKGIMEHVIKQVIPMDLVDDKTKIYINRTGKFVVGGPHGDSGLTGRKIIVDSHGVENHGGGAFCISGDSLVNYEYGTKPISELSNVEEGTLIKTDISPTPLGRWIDNGEMTTIIVETLDGYRLEGTENQNIRVIDKNGNYIWRRLDSLEPDDWIAIQKKNRLFGSQHKIQFDFEHKEGTFRSNEFNFPDTLTEDYSYLMGLLIGDGRCTSKDGVQVCVCDDEMKIIVQNLYRRLFGDEGKIFGHWAHYCGVELRAYLYHMGLDYQRSWQKQIPKSVFTSPKPVVAAFLQGLFDTDGTVRKTGRNMNSIEINLASTSLPLIKQTQQLLLNFDIVSAIQSIDPRKYTYFIQGRQIHPKRMRYHLRIKGSSSVKLFQKHIGFRLPRKAIILNSVDLSLKQDFKIIPHQRLRVKRLWDKLSSKEHQADNANIGRWLRNPSSKGTKNLTYTKLIEFLDTYKDKFEGDLDYENLKSFYVFNHYYTQIKSISKGRTHVYDFEVPGMHTFTANGFICHNSGKDASKVDRSASYYARYAAKNIVAAELAEKCEIQVSYAIGEPIPLSINIDCFGTEKIELAKIHFLVNKVFDFRPGHIIAELDLKRPIFKKTAAYGHFGRTEPEFTWERTDKVDALKKLLSEL